MGILYHYTSFSSFVNIIESGKLRMYDITKSNDPLEGKFALESLNKAFVEYTSKQNNGKKYRFLDKSLKEFEERFNPLDKTSKLVFATCFCEPVHELLLWRSYGDNGRGIAIGVNSEKLETLNEEDDFEFKTIDYYDDEKMQAKCFDYWIKYIDKFYTDNKDNSPTEEMISDIEKFYYQSFFIKHDSNFDECEHRLINYGPKLSDYFLPGCGEKAEGVKALSKDNDVIFYSELDLVKSGIVNNFVIGPQCNVTQTELRLLLRQNGIKDYSIEKSIIKMR